MNGWLAVVRLFALVLAPIVLAACLPAARFGVATPTPPLTGVPRDALEPAIDAVMGDTDSFAGLWLDGGGTVLHVMVATDDPDKLANVMQWLPPGAAISWHPARYSYRQLDDIVRPLVALLNENREEQWRPPVNAISVDIQRNRVTIGLDERAPEWEAEIRLLHGDAVEFVLAERARPLICDFPLSESTPEFCR